MMSERAMPMVTTVATATSRHLPAAPRPRPKRPSPSEVRAQPSPTAWQKPVRTSAACVSARTHCCTGPSNGPARTAARPRAPGSAAAALASATTATAATAAADAIAAAQACLLCSYIGCGRCDAQTVALSVRRSTALIRRARRTSKRHAEQHFQRTKVSAAAVVVVATAAVSFALAAQSRRAARRSARDQPQICLLVRGEESAA